MCAHMKTHGYLPGAQHGVGCIGYAYSIPLFEVTQSILELDLPQFQDFEGLVLRMLRGEVLAGC